MKNGINRFLITCIAVLAYSSSAFAACTNAQFAGTWDVVFSDGNTCRLILDENGEVLTAPDRSLSTCYDPFRGETAPDSGTYGIDRDCLATFELFVEGLEIQMGARLAQPRSVGAGIFVVFLPAEPWVQKGAITMLRVK